MVDESQPHHGLGAARRKSRDHGVEQRQRQGGAQGRLQQGVTQRASDRIVPDAIRSLGHGEPIPIRNKNAIRPWQHVLEPLSGYLWLAAILSCPSLRPQEPAAEFSSAFNFGPALESNRTVQQLIEEILKHWPGAWLDRHEPAAPHEAELLNLATDKANRLLGWRSIWSFEQAVASTIQWYRATAVKDHAAQLTREQITAYTEHARNLGMAWAANSG